MTGDEAGRNAAIARMCQEDLSAYLGISSNVSPTYTLTANPHYVLDEARLNPLAFSQCSAIARFKLVDKATSA